MKTFSIIIPIYNSERYLRRCLDSILAQNLKDYEVLLIDDHSTDRSSDIAKEYVEKHSCFQLISQPHNLGCSAARNAGIDAATGKYLLFMDSDDYWIGNVNYFLGCANENTLSISGFEVSHMGHVLLTNEVPEPSIISIEEYLKNLIAPNTQYFYGVLWNKIFSSQIIKSHHIYFSEHIDLCEEWPFLLEYVQFISNVTICPGVFYSYTQDNSNSLIKKIRPRGENWRIMLYIYQSVVHVFQKKGLYQENLTDINNILLNPIIKELIEIAESQSHLSVIPIQNFIYSDTVKYVTNNCRPSDTFEKLIIGCIRKQYLYLLCFLLHCPFLYSAPYQRKKLYYKVLRS